MFGADKLAKKLGDHLEARKAEWTEFADKRQLESQSKHPGENRDDILIARAVALMCTIMKNAVEEASK